MVKEDVIRRNNINIIGEGENVMIFAHGYGCDQSMFRYITSSFTDSFKIILFDHVGSGKSDESAYDYSKYSSLMGYADDVLEICHALSLKNITFVGHSVSSMIGLLAAVKEPELFDNLIMICPSPCYINDDDYYGGFSREDIDELLDSVESNYLGWSSSIAPVIMGNSDRPELTEELADSFCRSSPDISQHFAKVTFLGDNRDDLKKLQTKTLILQCSSDVIAPFIVGQYVHNNIKSSELIIMNATGHCPHLSAPQETIESISRYLDL